MSDEVIEMVALFAIACVVAFGFLALSMPR